MYQREFEVTANLLLDTVFQVNCGSTRAHIVRAFDKQNLQPFIIKFSRRAEVTREANVYKRLRDANLHYVPNEVVTINHRESRAGGTIDKSIGLKMPWFVTSLAGVPTNHAPETLVHTRAAADILPALVHMHSLNIFHMDVKLENIMMDTQGMWYLGDFGSCVSHAEEKYAITTSKKPIDLSHTPPSARYDKILLAVACMDLTVNFLAKYPVFSMLDLKRAAEDELKNEDFKAFIRSLIE